MSVFLMSARKDAERAARALPSTAPKGARTGPTPRRDRLFMAKVSKVLRRLGLPCAS